VSAPASTSVQRHRLFFALMPPAIVAAQIAHRAPALGLAAGVVAPERLHLTLAFIGCVDAQGRQAARAAGDAIDARAFMRVIDRALVNWLAPAEPPLMLLNLSRKLYKNTLFGIDKHGFKPHITIARKAGRLGKGPIEPITWLVTHFSLVASGTAGAPGAYRELWRWPLSRSPVAAARL